MAKIKDTYQPLNLFPKKAIEYSVELTQQEQDSIFKFLDKKFQDENGDPESFMYGPEVNFKLSWMEENVINNEPEFKTLKDTFLQLAFHFLSRVENFELHPDMYLDICDSWFVQVGSDPGIEKGSIEVFRRHNHAHALLTSVLYLDDSDNGLTLIDDIESPYHPFIMRRKGQKRPMSRDEHNIKSVRGKLIMFPAWMHHGLIQTNDGANRSSIVCNFWPSGVIGTTRGSQNTSAISGNGMSYREFNESN